MRWVVSPLSLGLLGALVGLVVVGYALLPRGRKNRLRQFVAGFKDTTTVDFYRDFLWTLSKLGVRKHPALTAREFAVQVRASIADEGIDFITEKFCEMRYRGTPPEAEDRRRIDEILARLASLPGTK